MVAINDRVKETTTTTGQGTVDLGGAKTGFETFVERIGNGNQTYYCIAAEGGAEFEVGIGTVTDATPDTLSRDTVLSNSDNNTNKVNFSAGTKEVFSTLPASKAILEDSANNMNVAGSIIVGGTVDGVDIQARDGVLTATTTTANAALPKAGGTMTGNISHASNFTLDMGGEITLDADGAVINLHDGGVSTGKIDLTNSDITLAASVADKDIKFQGIDGSSTITALTLDMSSEGALVINSNMKVPDNGKVLFGAGNDLQLSHNSSDAADRIESSNTLQLRTDTFRLENAAGTENMIAGNADGAVTLYHNDSAKLATSSSGVDVTGALVASGNVTAFSDERLKSDVKTIDNALDKVSQMRGVTFIKDDKQGSGVIAQELEKIAPELVLDGEYKSVAYGNIVGYVIEAIKELKGDLDNHKKHCTCGAS